MVPLIRLIVNLGTDKLTSNWRDLRLKVEKFVPYIYGKTIKASTTKLLFKRCDEGIQENTHIAFAHIGSWRIIGYCHNLSR